MAATAADRAIIGALEYRARLSWLVACASVAGFTCAAEAYAGEGAVAACLDSSETAQRARVAGRYAEARVGFASCAAPSCPVAVRNDCLVALTALDAVVPSLVIVVRDEHGDDILDAKTWLDERPVNEERGRALAVDPGNRRVRVEAPGFATDQRVVVANPGEKNRVVRFTLIRQRDAATTAARPTARAPVPLGTWLLGGVGVVATGVSVGFGVSGARDASTLRNEPCATLGTCDIDSVQSIRGRLLVADVALGVAAVSAVGALWLWLRGSSATRATGALR